MTIYRMQGRGASRASVEQDLRLDLARRGLEGLSESVFEVLLEREFELREDLSSCEERIGELHAEMDQLCRIERGDAEAGPVPPENPKGAQAG